MAAGLGFKDFATGEVLTAADVDGYLMQGIWVFASNAARDAAVTAPAEGNFAFTKDTNSLWYYDGAAWVSSGATGDIEGVTAGVGISGGGTSGTVTVTNSMATAIDAKGDLIVGTGADTFSRLAVGGTNGHILTVDSGEATGMKWAAPAAGGMTLLTSGTLSGASTTISFTPTGYINALLVIQGASINSGDQIFFRINGNSGGVYQASYTTRQGTTAGANYVSFINNGTYLLTDGTCSSGTDINATFLVYEVDKSANHAFQCNLNYSTGLGEAQNNWTGKINDTNTVTSMSIHRLGASATFSGNYYLYGIK